MDPTKVCITGVSRYGKAAIVAAAFDTRVAATFTASSGGGGTKLFRHIFGELLENLATRGGYHWMAGNYFKYSAEEAATLIGGESAWRQHDGGHTNVPNFPAFYEWAGRYISSPGLSKKK